MAEEWFPVCAPKLLSGPGLLSTPADLAGQTLLHISTYPDEWQRWLRMAGFAEVSPGRELTFDDNNAALEAAIAGLGVALGRPAYVEADLRAGRLVDPFKIHLPRNTAFYVVSSLERANEPAVAAFRDWVLSEVRDT